MSGRAWTLSPRISATTDSNLRENYFIVEPSANLSSLLIGNGFAGKYSARRLKVLLVMHAIRMSLGLAAAGVQSAAFRYFMWKKLKIYYLVAVI